MAIKQYSNKNVAVLKKLKEIDKRLDKIEQNQKNSLNFAVMGLGSAFTFGFGGIYFSQPSHDITYLFFAFMGTVLFVAGYIEFIRTNKSKK